MPAPSQRAPQNAPQALWAPSPEAPAQLFVPVFGIAPEFGALPTSSLQDTNEQWALFFQRGAPIGVKEGACIRPAVFIDGAETVCQSNVEYMSGAIFDVDDAEALRRLVPELGDAATDQQRFEVIWRRLEYRRMSIWTTYNHRANAPRYRLIVPFARPVEPGHYRYFWNEINNLLQGISADRQWNLDRLGYNPRVPSAEAQAEFTWRVWGSEADRLDPYARFGQPQQSDSVFDMTRAYVRVEIPAGHPDRADWISDEEAVQKARRYFNKVGPGVVTGNRHHAMIPIACKLFWDFWLDWEQAHVVLGEINNRFPEPHSASTVLKKLAMGFTRTRGSTAVEQRDQDGAPKEPGCLRKKPPGLTDGQLEQVARVERKSNDGSRKEVGGYLLNLRPNQHGFHVAIAPADMRVQATKLCASFLGERFPNHDVEKLAQLFAGSLAVSNGQDPGGPTVEDVRRWLVLAQERARQEREKQYAEAEQERQRLIKDAFGNGRTHEYTPDELEKFAAQMKCSVEEMRRRFVIVNNSNHYIFVNGDYKPPIIDKNFVNKVQVDLSPVPNVQLTRMTREGQQKLLERTEILARYGTIANEAIIDLAAQRSYYDYKAGCFVEAPCRLRDDIQPEQVQVIEDWINTFPDPFLIKHWISYVTNLDTEPLPALYLHGEKDSGKTLFAIAISKLYTRFRNFTPMETYFQPFNGGILRCPILVADEKLPEALLKKSGSFIFRELIQNQARPINRKFLSDTPARGYIRAILLANNDRMLPRGDDFMTDHDVAATKERYIVVDMKTGPADFLANLSKAQRDAIIDKDLLAKYALWARDNRPERNNKRFAVTSDMDATIVGQFEYAGLRSKILSWIYLAVTGQGAIPLETLFPLFYDKSAETREELLHVGVSASVIYKNWAAITNDQPKRPEMNDIADVLRTICYDIPSNRILHEGTRVRWRIVKTAHLLRWAARAGGDAESIGESLSAWMTERGTDKVFPFDSKEEARA